MTRWRRANRTTTILPDPQGPSRPPSLPPVPLSAFLSLVSARNFRGKPEILRRGIAGDGPRRRRSSILRAASSRVLRGNGRPSLFNGVVFTWSRAYRFPGRRRQIGFCALFPFASPALLRPFHPLASRAVLLPLSSRPVDAGIFTANYTIPLFLYERFAAPF